MHPVIEIFEKLAQIPHGSRNEKAISDFVADYARQRGFETVQDAVNNVIIKVPGTPGYENSKPVILQGHLDMVCEKTAESTHDFEKDPLKLRYEGDLLRAEGTTLGADDGVAVAYGLALLDAGVPHPPLELLFTVEEECSMKGAENFDPALFNGRLLINIDSEESDTITISAAGGMGLDYHIPLIWNEKKGAVYTLTVDGLQGGHSGAEIHKERASANKLMGRILSGLLKNTGVSIVSVRGGSKSNAIPIFAQAKLLLADPEKARELAEDWERALREEYAASDPNVRVSLKKTDETAARVWDEESVRKFIAAVRLTPAGPERRDPALGIVLNSRNMSIIETREEEIYLQNSLRSSVDSLLDEMSSQMELLADTLGFKSNAYTRYAGWAYLRQSPLRELAVAEYERLFGEKPKVLAIHAGLEIGCMANKLPGLDAISIGPDVRGAHTPSETLSISSVERIYRLLSAILENLK